MLVSRVFVLGAPVMKIARFLDELVTSASVLNAREEVERAEARKRLEAALEGLDSPLLDRSA